jgi:hypothetical protein
MLLIHLRHHRSFITFLHWCPECIKLLCFLRGWPKTVFVWCTRTHLFKLRFFWNTKFLIILLLFLGNLWLVSQSCILFNRWIWAVNFFTLLWSGIITHIIFVRYKIFIGPTYWKLSWFSPILCDLSLFLIIFWLYIPPTATYDNVSISIIEIFLHFIKELKMIIHANLDNFFFQFFLNYISSHVLLYLDAGKISSSIG